MVEKNIKNNNTNKPEDKPAKIKDKDFAETVINSGENIVENFSGSYVSGSNLGKSKNNFNKKLTRLMALIMVVLSVTFIIYEFLGDKIMIAMNSNPQIEIVVAGADGKTLGTMVAELYPDVAPKHVERIETLAKRGFYNGLKFHRVIEDFMVQTGDPKGDGTGNSDLPNLKAEFNNIKHVRGVLSMARSQNPNSANSQFFIMLADAPHLDGEYTAFGRVVSGIDTLDKIQRGDARHNGMVQYPSIIKSMKVISE